MKADAAPGGLMSRALDAVIAKLPPSPPLKRARGRPNKWEDMAESILGYALEPASTRDITVLRLLLDDSWQPATTIPAHGMARARGALSLKQPYTVAQALEHEDGVTRDGMRRAGRR